jgi:hypothetical protein
MLLSVIGLISNRWGVRVGAWGERACVSIEFGQQIHRRQEK